MDARPDAPGVTASQLARLLDLSLAAWRIPGRACAPGDRFPVSIELADGTGFAVVPADAREQPIRWWILWRAPVGGATPVSAPTRVGETGDGRPGAGARSPRIIGDGAANSRVGAEVPVASPRRKPCASVAGLLRTLRETLGVAGQSRVRVGVSP